MVGAEREEVAPPPSANVVVAPTCAVILPRRILFHPPLKMPQPTASSLALTPLNLPPPRVSPSSSSAVVDDLSHHKTSLRPTMPLPSLRIQRIGAGLNNLGNTCFLNAVLQCLTYTPPLAAYFQAGLHQSSCRSVGFCAMCTLERHVKQALSAQGRVISPNLLVKNLRCISRSFQMGRQEDAHEYMRYLIEALQKSCPLEAHANFSSSSHRNFIQRIFGGRLQSQVKCTQCSQSSNTYDPFLDLSLDIVKAESLLKALARFTAIEVLDGDNKYHCCKCKAKVRAHKQFTIDYAPHVLTVQFKRFSSSGGYGGKIDKRVQFDRNLNLKPFVNGGKEGGLRYSLYAVLVHSGWSTHSGHYFCFVRTSTDIWHKLDDNRVSQVSEKIVLEQKAYILFYVRDTEVLPTSNGNSHGIKSERFLTSNGTSGTAKRVANGMSIHKDTSQLKGILCVGSTNDNLAARSLSTTVTNDMHTDVRGIPNDVEVLTNGNTVRALASATTKACNPAPVGAIDKDHSTKLEVSGAFSLFNDHMNNNNVDILNNGKVQTSRYTNGLSQGSQAKACTLAPADRKLHQPNGTQVVVNSCLAEKKMRRDNDKVQMNGYTNGLSPGSQAKACTLASAESKLHLPNCTQKAENSCLAERKMKRNEIFPHEISGTGSVTNVKEADAKVEKLRRLEGPATLFSREKANFGLAVSSSTSFEKAVPHWEEDAEENKDITVEEQNLMAETVAHCGHVLDEWDEEYDRGKRKKLRRRDGGKHEMAEVSESLHIEKRCKKVSPLPQEHRSTAAPTGNGNCHENVFQAFAGKRAQPELDTARLKKSRKRQRALGHKLFLKRYRFKQLHTNRQHRRKR